MGNAGSKKGTHAHYVALATQNINVGNTNVIGPESLYRRFHDLILNPSTGQVEIRIGTNVGITRDIKYIYPMTIAVSVEGGSYGNQQHYLRRGIDFTTRTAGRPNAPELTISMRDSENFTFKTGDQVLVEFSFCTRISRNTPRLIDLWQEDMMGMTDGALNKVDVYVQGELPLTARETRMFENLQITRGEAWQGVDPHNDRNDGALGFWQRQNRNGTSFTPQVSPQTGYITNDPNYQGNPTLDNFGHMDTTDIQSRSLPFTHLNNRGLVTTNENLFHHDFAMASRLWTRIGFPKSQAEGFPYPGNYIQILGQQPVMEIPTHIWLWIRNPNFTEAPLFQLTPLATGQTLPSHVWILTPSTGTPIGEHATNQQGDTFIFERDPNQTQTGRFITNTQYDPRYPATGTQADHWTTGSNPPMRENPDYDRRATVLNVPFRFSASTATNPHIARH